MFYLRARIDLTCDSFQSGRLGKAGMEQQFKCLFKYFYRFTIKITINRNGIFMSTIVTSLLLAGSFIPPIRGVE